MKNSYAVYYVTPPGESECEGWFVARSAHEAIRAFRRQTGTIEGRWSAKRLTDPHSKSWCEGYIAHAGDADEWKESVAARHREQGLKPCGCPLPGDVVGYALVDEDATHITKWARSKVGMEQWCPPMRIAEIVAPRVPAKSRAS